MRDAGVELVKSTRTSEEQALGHCLQGDAALYLQKDVLAASEFYNKAVHLCESIHVSVFRPSIYLHLTSLRAGRPLTVGLHRYVRGGSF